jgi:hypothetical protein
VEYRTLVVSDADTDEAHAPSLDVIRKWFDETSAASSRERALVSSSTDESGLVARSAAMAVGDPTARVYTV